MEKTLFLRFFKVSVDDLFDNLESEKRLKVLKFCFGKSLEKVLNFGFKNLYEPCTGLPVVMLSYEKP